ncbi:MAG: BadF/BadG/BcrA/BcrD ATPase family protein, partial [Archaeoglobaceae archaeon]
MISAGIDIGSITAKCMILKNGKILGYKITKAKPDLEGTAKEIFEDTLRTVGLKREEIEKIVATGYGRNMVSFADKKITEI